MSKSSRQPPDKSVGPVSEGLALTPLESALFHITECSVKTSSMEEYASQLHLIIKQLMYAENFFVALYRQDQSSMSFIYIADEHNQEAIATTIKNLSEQELRRTITGYMLRTGKVQHLSGECIRNLVAKNIVDSIGHLAYDWLGVPLVFDNQILGGIVVQSYRPDIKYGEKEKGILQFVARQIALVFKSRLSEKVLIDANTALEKRVDERTRDLHRMNAALATEVLERKKSQQIQSALFQITELVSTTESLDDFYAHVHEIIGQVMYAKNEYIAILTEDRKYLEFPYFVDQFDKTPIRRLFNQGEYCKGVTEKVIISGRAHLSPREEEGIAGTGECYSWLGVPLKDKQHVFGVLAIQSYEPDQLYTHDDQNVLLTIGHQVATAILRKKDADSLRAAHELLEKRVRERTSELEDTIERRKVVEQKLAHESLHDALTGLPNRLNLIKNLNRMINQPDKADKKLALLFLDLDRFKVINDSLGHHIGDLFLIEVAKKLQTSLRANDLIARLGGDEFCILMYDIQRDSVALNLCSRILKELKKPIVVAKHSLISSASIGVRLASLGENSAETIMSDADAAMYQAKNQGKNRYCFFDATIKMLVTQRMKMERDLRDAVDNHQLYLVYQPLVNLDSRKIEGFEALVRWHHPVNGLVSPVEFIPVAEETGLIVEIGEAVVEMACQMLSRFKQAPLLADLYINVNVSSVQVLARTLDSVIRKNLQRYLVDPEKLNIEITESILIEDYKAALNFVRELKAMNIKVYLDDFGTGYSSLSYLHKFPFDAIKLDRSFIQVINDSRQNEAIVESIGLLASNLNIHIVAEGIETREQLIKVQHMHYHVAQGFYFAKPLAEHKVEVFVKSFDYDAGEDTILQ
ncbi:EAL domain-containing protein [Aliikangiella maris]|uniref:EAL domain-containing protein n=2 Tax=Aliikangiella maris TaxID=3162458 RepID=A0ABV3MQ44_9GAMM